VKKIRKKAEMLLRYGRKINLKKGFTSQKKCGRIHFVVKKCAFSSAG
jgi:hypothetical protein